MFFVDLASPEVIPNVGPTPLIKYHVAKLHDKANTTHLATYSHTTENKRVDCCPIFHLATELHFRFMHEHFPNPLE
jgi:hypothetical protein